MRPKGAYWYFNLSNKDKYQEKGQKSCETVKKIVQVWNQMTDKEKEPFHKISA